MTQLLDPPQPLEVEVDDAGQPRHVQGRPLAGPVRPVVRWIIEVDWWTSSPVSREYWRVLLRERLMCEIYRDRAGGAWYLERVYD
ncbi:MAG: hypothetical protein E6J41_21420 [Chloroflexi bacterium]|nr:MAG: hypothetical protein E6J41_21420 [Chloroflexota bacterium]